jgi:pimeloyl-ACP methyl ester carboxylesterase
MKILTLLLLLFSAYQGVTGQEAVFFFATDSNRVRGDLYLTSNQLPFIILCHPEEARHEEFREVAPRLLNLNYNCLAIHLRHGTSLLATRDILAAMQYIRDIGNQYPVILMGSSYSASLCLLVTAENPAVKAVIALSPGEYFLPVKSVSEEVKKIRQQVFVSSTLTEFPYLQTMLSGIPAENVTLFKPTKDKGVRGSAALCHSNPDHAEYWFALMMFFKKLS